MVIFHSYVKLPEGNREFFYWIIIIPKILGSVIPCHHQPTGMLGFKTCSLGGIEGGYDVYIMYTHIYIYITIYILCINFKSCRDIHGNILRICAFTSCNEICRYTQNVCIQYCVLIFNMYLVQYTVKVYFIYIYIYGFVWKYGIFPIIAI